MLGAAVGVVGVVGVVVTTFAVTGLLMTDETFDSAVAVGFDDGATVEGALVEATLVVADAVDACTSDWEFAGPDAGRDRFDLCGEAAVSESAAAVCESGCVATDPLDL